MVVWVNVWGKALGRCVGLVAVAWSLVGCIDDFDHPEGYGAGASGGSNGSGSLHYACIDLCNDTRSCSDISATDCARQCANIEGIVRDAGCRDSFDSALRCISRLDDPCAEQQQACYSPINDFSTCIALYCQEDPGRCPTLE
jgi:hypothetical protein